MKNTLQKILNSITPSDATGPIFAVLLLRIWLGVRSLQAGIEKYYERKLISSPIYVDGLPDPNGLEEIKSIKVYGLDKYNGVPEPLYAKFLDEPIIHWWSLKLYDAVLGPTLIILGVFVLLGVLTRLSLFALGLVYVSLTYGLILLNESSGVAWLAAHVILIALMLLHVQHNRLELGRFAMRCVGLKETATR